MKKKENYIKYFTDNVDEIELPAYVCQAMFNLMKLENMSEEEIYKKYEFTNNCDFEEQNLNLIKNDKLIFKIMNEDNTELDFNLSAFMRYVIKKKEVIFTPAEIVAELNLLITPSSFGRLLNSNIKRLEQEGIYVELNRTATSRNYKAKFIEPLNLED